MATNKAVYHTQCVLNSMHKKSFISKSNQNHQEHIVSICVWLILASLNKYMHVSLVSHCRPSYTFTGIQKRRCWKAENTVETRADLSDGVRRLPRWWSFSFSSWMAPSIWCAQSSSRTLCSDVWGCRAPLAVSSWGGLSPGLRLPLSCWQYEGW